MLRRSRPIAMLATFVAVVAASPAFGAHAQDRYKNHSIPPVTAAQIANDVRARAEMGLRADRAYVTVLLEDAAAGVVEASTSVGAIVTLQEEAAIKATTTEVDRVVAVADDYFEHRRDIYAGMWIDQARGLVGIGVTDEYATHQRALAPLIGTTSVTWHVREMENSLDTLYAIQRSLDASLGNLETQAVIVSSTSIDEEQNRVYVGVSSDTTTAQEAIASRFSDAPIVVEYEVPPVLDGVSGQDAPPLRGGQRISRPNTEKPGYEISCTSAFVAYQVERTDAAIFLVSYYLTTAGHCETVSPGVGGVGAIWMQGGHFVGQSKLNAFRQGSYADAMGIPFSTAWRSNQIAISPGDYRSVHCLMTTDVKQGQIEIVSGARTGGYRTGKLLRTNATVVAKDATTGRKTTIVRQHMSNYFSQQGDSGASVFGTRECSHRAQGIHSAGGSGRTYYTPMTNALQSLGLAGVEIKD